MSVEILRASSIVRSGIVISALHAWGVVFVPFCVSLIAECSGPKVSLVRAKEQDTMSDPDSLFARSVGSSAGIPEHCDSPSIKQLC